MVRLGSSSVFYWIFCVFLILVGFPYFPQDIILISGHRRCIWYIYEIIFHVFPVDITFIGSSR